MTISVPSKAVLVEIGGFLVSIYGFLTTTSVAQHLPAAATAVLLAVGPSVTLLRLFLNHPSTGTPTIPVKTPAGVVNVPVAPIAPPSPNP